MLPQRPAGAPPPRPGGKPPGSPPAAPLGKPPGPPPGPPPGSPGQAVAAKAPPTGPPPATASSSVGPSKPPPGAPPPRAEAKAPAPVPVPAAKKAPPPPRVGAPASPPPPQDGKKDASEAEGRSSPRPPPGKPPGGPTRATPPPGSPASPAGSPPPRGPPPGRPPPGSPPSGRTSPPSSPPPRGPPPRGPPPRGPPPRGPPPRSPPGKPPGAPPSAGVSPAPVQSSDQLQQQQQQQQQGVVVGREQAGAGGGEGERGSAGMGNGGEPEQGRGQPPGGRDAGGGRDRGAEAASPPPVKRPKTPPPSAKAPPGVPHGMVPPKAQPPSTGTGSGQQAIKAMDVDTGDGANTGGITAEQPGEGEDKKDSPTASPARARAASPPGDPGRRRPPAGPPPGRRPPTIAPPTARPAPPSVEDVALLAPKDEEQIIIADENELEAEEENVPPPPEGLPPPDGLSDDDDDDEEDALAEGQIVGVDEDDASEGGVAAKDLEVLRRGRFIVRCIEGGDVKKSALSNKTPTVDPYLRVTLGKHKRAPTRKTKVVKRSGVSPNFESEKLVFDIVEPDEFVVGGDVTLSIEIWDDSAWSDDLLASVKLSALRFMHPDAIPSAEWFPLEAPSGRIKDRMKVLVEISFEPALLGMFVLTLHEGKGLGAHDPASRPNPYVVATLGEMYQKRSRAAKGGGSAPVFRQEEIVLWIDKENWTNDLQLQVRSEDIGTDAELGSAKISVLHAMDIPPEQATERKIELLLEGQPAGQLFAKCVFLPAGKLSFVCESGRGLRETSAAGRMDPYVTFKADGQAVSLSRKTKVDKDGGMDPRWNETIEIDVVDQYTLWLECFNHDVLDSDELIGSAQCSLLPVFKRGTLDTWIQLTCSSGPGPPKEAGEIHCVFSFKGPLGVAYPQHQPGVDSFDDSLRVNLRGYLEVTNEEDQTAGRPEEETTAIVGHQDQPPLERSTEFTDDEISAAFKFLDLDRNLHIGAAEIRHILICMGELITDEEVDMMISMVDSDGDGQVSFEEFHRLVIDPDPSRADFSTEPITSNNDGKEAARVSQEMKDRESKRWLLEDFVKENEIRAVELEMAYKRFQNLAPSRTGDKQATSSVEMDFNTWILVFNVEATGQYRKLFKLYALPGTGGETDAELESQKVDIREFFLGMANFVEWSLEPRTQFIFTLFDDDRSGFLSMDELVAVLKANHLATAKAVAKKAQTIMKQADADGSGTLTLDEFLVVAKKFPNLLFPAKPKTNETQPQVPMLGNG